MKGPDALLLLKPGGGKPPLGKSAPKPPAEDYGSAGGAKVRAARRLRQAIQAHDDGAIAAAFSAMYDACAGGGEDDEGAAEELAEGGTEEG